ncbi:MAG TPA: hypothetical protein VMM77_02165 [Gemmatimonadaceae bacterium]|nr:hypothetical protein [Gemmatimonadaceae bacterium]
MITLRDLAAWESRVASIVAQVSGTLEERDRALERAGLYAEYPAILSGYLALLDDESSAPEALKRAVFLVWYSGVEPPVISGIAELPEIEARAALDALDAVCRADQTDEELRWMLAWYHEVADYAILRVPGLLAVQAVIDEGDSSAWQRAALSREQMEGRGLLGRYWLSLARSD